MIQFKLILNYYLLLIALFVSYEAYGVIRSDLSLIKATGILRTPLEENLYLLKEGYEHVTEAVKNSPENPRAHHYRAIYLAKLSLISDSTISHKRKKQMLDESMQEITMARKSMPLNWHLEKDMILIAKIKWQVDNKLR